MSHDVAARCADPDRPERRNLTALRHMLLDQRQSRRDQLQGLTHHPEADDARLDAVTRRRMIVATRAALDEIDEALERYDDGTYGSCARCLSSIPVGHLMAYPQLRYCLGCVSTR